MTLFQLVALELDGHSLKVHSSILTYINAQLYLFLTVRIAF